MKKVKRTVGKLSLVTVISLGLMVVGIGCVIGSMLSMWQQSSNFTGKLNLFTDDNNVSSVEYGKLSTKLVTDQAFLPETTTGVYTEKVDAKSAIYTVYPEAGEMIGILTIPAFNQKLIILQGTTNEELKEGVGHFLESVLPGEADNCVLSGHRDTVFKRIGELKLGDKLIVKTSAGTFTYAVSGTRIVDKDDKTVIVPTEDAVLTMTTCYPFDYLGDAPERYIVSAGLIENK